ncbi:MAG: sugar phosphate isomerase/epimerase [Thermoguttaceae bacterium]
MHNDPQNRRNFLQSAGGVVGAAMAAAWLPSAARAGEAPAVGHPIRLGGPIFQTSDDPEAMALAHKKLGYRAAYCPNAALDNAQRIRDLSRAFARHDVILAEVGRWCNLLDPDATRRAANLKTVTEGLALAEAVGARCCVDIAGSFNPQVWFGPHAENLSRRFFDAAVENARKIIDAVRPKRARFCYEMMGWALPDTADSYRELIAAVDRKAMAVHLDPCNVVNSPGRFYNTTAVLNELFDKLGPWIVSCHAKDIAWSNPVEMNVHILEVLPGKGVLDYGTYLKRLAGLPGDVPLMLEHLSTAEEYDKGRRYIMEAGGKAGVRFE